VEETTERGEKEGGIEERKKFILNLILKQILVVFEPPQIALSNI